ncbi:hypothetical protein JVT61DRAFT_1494 [Boletus reticuloceps]|uniref:DNA-directed RNA polymerase n=1 Tax=Boletus reticuloceps TaxID=495285 RepID=A0A8I2YBZ4_9AGAM|nr:hypothetical protein JVT61DRAFT_1494 [Boletus reticuloceps]
MWNSRIIAINTLMSQHYHQACMEQSFNTRVTTSVQTLSFGIGGLLRLKRYLNFILFNRQPSLMLLPVYPTFWFNLSVTPPYNADFDGDGMNMPHIPQSEETRAKLGQIAWVPRQDTLCSIRKFTLRDTFLDWNHIQNILLWLPDLDGNVPTPVIIKPKPLWTGKQILSMVIPRGINIHHAPDPKSWNPVFDDGMMVDNGEILFRIMDKKTVGATQGGLIHVVFRPMVMGYIIQRIGEKKQQVAEIIDNAYHDRLKPMPGMTI